MVALKRLIIIAWVISITGCSPATSPPAPMNDFEKAWQRFVALFYEHGRIVDTGNGDVSHSEGQGYGMLFAVAANDKVVFDALWQWTQSNLQRDDHLFHWQYTPCPHHDNRCVSDPNNASDGDMLIAWALLRAASRWQASEYKQAAMRIIQSLERLVIVQANGYTLLLPGQYGFVAQNQSVQVNLSYWIFPAIAAFAENGDSERWRALYESGLELLDRAQFGEASLPPDWLRVNPDSVSLDDTLSTEYGFNACRIPLHLVWASETQASVLSALTQFWRQPTPPATVNLVTGETASYTMTPGMQAVASAVNASLSATSAVFPELHRHTDYYSGSLILFSMLAMQERAL